MAQYDSYQDLLAQLQSQSGSSSHGGSKPSSLVTPRMTPRAVQKEDNPSVEEGHRCSSGDYHKVDDALGEVDDDLGPEERG
jgi:hypothetical protein